MFQSLAYNYYFRRLIVCLLSIVTFGGVRMINFSGQQSHLGRGCNHDHFGTVRGGCSHDPISPEIRIKHPPGGDHNQPLSIGLTTNGVGFTRRANALRQAGLESVNLSLDSLNRQRLTDLTGGFNVMKQVMSALYAALDLGFDPIKINCVLTRGQNEDEICNFVELTRKMPIEVRFIEYMPFDGNNWERVKLVPHLEVLKTIKTTYPQLEPFPTHPSETARRFAIPGYLGRIGLISSMTANFCSTCTRLRLTADGCLKTCLHGSSEVNLVNLVRTAGGSSTPSDTSNSQLRQLTDELYQSTSYSPQLTDILQKLDLIVDKALQAKAPRHEGMEFLAKCDNRSMVRIGG